MAFWFALIVALLAPRSGAAAPAIQPAPTKDSAAKDSAARNSAASGYSAARNSVASGYETVVRGRTVKRRAPPDDPAAFATHLDISAGEEGDLATLLAEVPGLRILDLGGAGGQTITLRGVAGHRVAVYLDGVRLSSPGLASVDLSLFDPAHLEAVEVLRSAGSARYGDAALAGALILRTPRLRRRRRTRLSIGYGSWRSLKASASHSGAWSRLRYLASASYRQSAGDFPFFDEVQRQTMRRINNDVRAGEALLKADLLLGDWQLALTDSALLAERGMPGPAFNERDDTRQTEARNVLALSARRLDWLVDGGRLSLALSQRYQRLRYDDASQAANRSYSQFHGIEARARGLIPMAGWGRIDAAAELRGEFFVDDLAGGQASVGDHQRLLLDAFVAAQFGLFGGRLLLVPAVRLASASNFGVRVVPKLGVALALWRSSGEKRSRLELLGNIGRSVRYPSFNELYAQYEGIRGNAALRPEDALAADAGFRFSLPALTVEAAYFVRSIANAIRFVRIDALSMATKNFGRARSQGVEVGVEARPWRCLALRGAYTFTRARYAERGYHLPGQPDHLLAARLGWDGPGCGRMAARLPRWLRRLSLWTSVQLQGPLALGQGDDHFEEGRLLVSAGGSYRYRWLTFSAAGRNLTDKRDAVDVLGYPLPPARFFASLRVSF